LVNTTPEVYRCPPGDDVFCFLRFELRRIERGGSMSDHDAFAERGRALEEEYFRKKDRELVEKMRRTAAADQARGDLSKQTGVSDPSVLAELQELGFTADTVILLPLMPLLEMAWAEGGVTPAERQMLVSLARSRGIAEDSAADRQLNAWIAARPAPEVFTKSARLISALLDSGAPAANGLTADQLVKYAEQIASASGGLLGLPIRSVSMEERDLLARIAEDLKGRR
jgi:hypothetical protein